MALKLGSKNTLYSYRDKSDAIAEMVKHALLMIENQHEECLMTRQSCTGNIFALKNMGWSDKQEVDTNIKGNVIICTGVPEPGEE